MARGAEEVPEEVSLGLSFLFCTMGRIITTSEVCVCKDSSETWFLRAHCIQSSAAWLGELAVDLERPAHTSGLEMWASLERAL